MSVLVKQSHHIVSFKSSDNWVILSDIERRIKEKVEKYGVPLKDWDIKINYGIKTGYNEAFIIDGKKKEDLIRKDPKSDEIIRPILRGRDIKRYGYDFADLWLINTHNGIKEKGIKPINIKDYPAIKRHLDEYWKQIEKRADQGDTPYNLRNCAYMEDFYKQKIAWNRISSQKVFGLIEAGLFIHDSMHFITGKNLEYICATLNSKLFEWLLAKKIGDSQGGNSGNSENIRNLRVKYPENNLDKLFKNLLLEKNYEKINELVFESYQLESTEINYIDENL